MSFESAFADVAQLVENFRAHEAEYLNVRYQESECRQSFIDKFFIALGWDVYHHSQTNPREQEVKIERGDHVSTRRADYAFYLKPDYQRPQFLVEAKKPSVILAAPDPYFQTARYGFNTSTSVALLTNFRELHIIDCRRKPVNAEGIVDSAKLKIYGLDDYLDRDKFGEIYWTFSHEAVETGKLKEYRKSLPKPKGKSKQLKLIGDNLAPVDDQFLAELDEHRKTLASAFKKSNPQLTSEELTEAAQKVLDRLVFIRFLEDKMIEPDFIVDTFGIKGSSWRKFVTESRHLDKKYNGVVFKDHFIDRPSFAPPDDERFFAICEEMNHRNSPYLFSYIPVEILGSIYERFLGKVVVTKGRGIAVEEKPEVRKAGGVYYTPKYIVDYIVENTVGKLIEGKTPKEIAKLRFADIACGSGSFLIAVFDHVAHYLERWYNDHPDEAKKSPRLLKAGVGGWSLSLESKRQILKQNIYGVDIDHQAVEVAQFSLFLKLLESETISTAEAFQTDAFTTTDKTILPDLSKNILCGNSLVEYDIAQLFPLTEEEEERIKPFSFQSSFKEIMQAGGFDAIVGNPPYVIITKDLFDEWSIKYLLTYQAAEYKADLFHLFIERAIRLLKDNGRFGYITPNPWLTQVYTSALRTFILTNTTVEEIVTFKGSVFQAATVNTLLLFLRKKQPESSHVVSVIDTDLVPQEGIRYSTEQSAWTSSEGSVIETRRLDAMGSLVDKICARSTPLGSLLRASLGCQAYNSSKHSKKQIEGRVFHSDVKLSEEYLPELAGNDVSRYRVERLRGQWIKYGPWLHDYRSMDWLTGPRVLIREISGKQPYALQAAYVEETYCNYKTILNINPKEHETFPMKYALGVLNSKLVSRIYPYMSNKMVASAFPRLSVGDLRKIPFPTQPSAQIEQTIIAFVEQMSDSKQRIALTQSDSQREQLQRKCDYLDSEIDRLVYQLYGLTEEEIAIVEGRG